MYTVHSTQLICSLPRYARNSWNKISYLYIIHTRHTQLSFCVLCTVYIEGIWARTRVAAANNARIFGSASYDSRTYDGDFPHLWELICAVNEIYYYWHKTYKSYKLWARGTLIPHTGHTQMTRDNPGTWTTEILSPKILLSLHAEDFDNRRTRRTQSTQRAQITRRAWRTPNKKERE